MLPLKGVREISGTKLYWSTVTVQNNKGFYIERSENGRTFNRIDFVSSAAALGNSNTRKDYSFSDIIIQQKAYHRPEQVDKGNHLSYSNTVYIDRSKMLNITVYPNPVKNEITINSKQHLTKIMLTNLSGKTIKQMLPTITNRYFVGDIPGGV